MNPQEQEATSLCEHTFARNAIWGRLWNLINDGHWMLTYDQARIAAEAALAALEDAGYEVVPTMNQEP